MTLHDAPSPLAVRAHGLGKTVADATGPLDLLEDINLEIAPGATVCVLGASGSGKSTLLALLAGLDAPTRGSVELFGQDLGALDEDGRARLRARHVGFVFQSFQLLSHLTALENVQLPLELLGSGRDERALAARAGAMLERVGLGARLHHRPPTLSGGEQQRVALARAFVLRPSILFADEPTGSLDARSGDIVADLLFELNREASSTLVLVTHDARLAARCARCVQLDGGRLSLVSPR